MCRKHLYAFKINKNVVFLKKNDKTENFRKIMKLFKVFDKKKSELACESFLSVPVCCFHSMNYKVRISRPQKYLHLEIFHEK